MPEEKNVNTDDKSDQNQTQNVNTDDKSDHMIPKSRFDQINTQKKELETTLQSIADDMKAELPEPYQSLVPSELSAAKQIDWIRTAHKSGIFENQKTKDGLDSKRPSDKKTTDFSTMSPTDLIEHSLKNPKT